MIFLMKNKRILDVIIFSIAVIMLLLRPFFVYQITENLNLSRNPVAASTLFQRLIKKKDDHHFADVQEISAIHRANKKRVPLLSRYTNSKTVSSRCQFLTVVPNPVQSTIFKVYAPSNYQRLLSKFQI
jgi:hypothetical protein